MAPKLSQLRPLWREDVKDEEVEVPKVEPWDPVWCNGIDIPIYCQWSVACLDSEPPRIRVPKGMCYLGWEVRRKPWLLAKFRGELVNVYPPPLLVPKVRTVAQLRIVRAAAATADTADMPLSQRQASFLAARRAKMVKEAEEAYPDPLR